MQSYSFNVPALGESVDEATITRWFKSVGDRVEVGDVLVELATDKVDTEVTSEHSGVILEILADEGETRGVGAEIMKIQLDDGPGDTPVEVSPRVIGAEDDPVEVADESPEAATSPSAAVLAAGTASTVGTAGTPADETSIPVAPEQTAPVSRSQTNPYLTLLVRKIATESGVNPNAVQGSGAGGRVTKADMLRAVSSVSRDAQSATMLRASKPSSLDQAFSCSLRVRLHRRLTIGEDIASSREARSALVTAISSAFAATGLSAPPTVTLNLIAIDSQSAEVHEAHSSATIDAGAPTFEVRVLGASCPEQEHHPLAAGTSMALSVGAVNAEVVAVSNGEAMAIQPVSQLTLGYRESQLDSTTAAQFLAHLVRSFEA